MRLQGPVLLHEKEAPVTHRAYVHVVATSPPYTSHTERKIAWVPMLNLTQKKSTDP